MHSSLLVDHRGEGVMIDCGVDWLDAVPTLGASAIILTHAHPDHAGGLRGGAPCPVYATEETWRRIGRYAIRDRRLVDPRTPLAVGGAVFEAFPVAHSLRAPAVGYRLTANGVSVFYVPDVAAIEERRDALSGVAVYVGDGASVTRPILRRRDGALVGHAPIRAQLDWCSQEGVARAIFSHCGSEIVGADEGALADRVRQLGRELGVEAKIARDGMEVVLS